MKPLITVVLFAWMATAVHAHGQTAMSVALD